MKEFWEDVTQSVLDILSISSSQLLEVLKTQEDEIVGILTYNCFLDDEVADEDTSQIKLEILKLYSDSIAKTISKLEVYYHDLPAEIVEALFELVQEIVGAELTEKSEQRRKYYNNVLKYAYFVKHLAELLLCRSYLERIKAYKKQLKNFKTKGIKIDEKQSFYDVAKREYRRLKKERSKVRKTFLSYLSKKKDIIKYRQVKKDIGASSLVSDFEKHIKFYEDYYPSIVGNGCRRSLPFRIFRIIIYVITCIIAVLSVLKFLNIFDGFSCIKTFLYSIIINQ